MKNTALFILMATLLFFSGCSTQSSHYSSNTSQVKSADIYYNDITCLKKCEESSFSDTSLYFDAYFQPVELSSLRETYFQQSSDNTCILLEPLRITAYYKTDENILNFQDTDSVSGITDSKESLKMNPSFSQIPGDIQFKEGYIAFYFYPKVSRKDYLSNAVISEKIVIGEETYCDGIYELRWSEDADPAL